MKKKIIPVLSILVWVAFIVFLVIVTRKRTIRATEYKIAEIHEKPYYYDYEEKQWFSVENNEPADINFRNPSQMICVEGFTPWDYYYGNGLPHVYMANAGEYYIIKDGHKYWLEFN